MTDNPDVEQVLQALRVRKPDVAETICREHLSEHPESVEHLRLLGHALIELQRYDEAETQFKRAIELAPNFAPVSEEMGNALAKQRKFEEAIPYFEKAVQLDPELASAHKKLGQALAAVGRGWEADEAFEAYLEKNPELGPVTEGGEHMRAGREDEAIECFRQALRDNPDNIDAMRFLAAVYLKQERKLRDAEALLLRITELAPDFAAAWLDLGHCYTKRAKRMDAIEAYKRATELEPRNANAWEKLASVTASAGYPEQAAEAFRKAIEFMPKAAGFHMGYGHVMKTLGDQPTSLAAYREAIRLRPDFGEVYWSMANLKIFKFEDDSRLARPTRTENITTRPGSTITPATSSSDRS